MPRLDEARNSANLTASGVSENSVVIFRTAWVIVSDERKAILNAFFKVLMVLREGGILILIGLGLGLALGLALAHLTRSQFYNVAPVDFISIAVTIVVLTVVSLAAAWIPARRAAKIDPMEALRYE